jgi:nucleoside-diphosphate-sugar epimerase
MKELINTLGGACGRKGFRIHIPSMVFYFITFVVESASKVFGMTPMLTKEKADELLASWLVSTERAEKYLGFKSRIAFPEGAKLTYEWYVKEGWLK